MFAVVVGAENGRDKLKIVEKTFENVGIFTVGTRVSSRRLNRALKKYNGEIIFSKTAKAYGIPAFDCSRFKEGLLFDEFANYVLSQNNRNIKIGIFDPKAQHLKSPVIPRLIAHAEETVIYTESNVDGLCRFWLKSTGMCPDVTENLSRLSVCDVCFAINGVATQGVLFGKNGRGINQHKLIEKIPEQYLFLLARQIDPAELLCMLENERKYCVI